MKNKWIKYAVWFLAGFFVLSHASDLLLLVLLFTFGVAVPLLFLNTVFLYVVAGLPLLYLLRRPSQRWLLISVAASAIPIVAFGIPYLADLSATRKANELRGSDIREAFGVTPKSVEIVAATQGYAGPNDPTKDAPCDEICQRLLLTERIDLVRVTRRSAGPRVFRMDYVFERRGDCPQAFGDDSAMLSETKQALASGRCIVAAFSGERPVTARIAVNETREELPANLAQDIAAGAVATRVKTLEIFDMAVAGSAPRVRQTEVEVSRWATPLYVFFAQCHGMCIGKPVLGRVTRIFNPVDSAAVALQTFGLDQEGPSRGLDPADLVASMLDNAGQGLTPNQTQLITDWAAGMYGNGIVPRRTMIEKDRRLADRLMQDRRVTNFVYIAEVLRREPTLVTGNMDMALTEMEQRGTNSDFSNHIGAIVARLEPAIVLAHRDRILAIIRERDWQWAGGDLGTIAGRLGIDTAPLIADRLRSSPAAAAYAACLADEPVARALVPHLLAYLAALPVTDMQPDAAARTAVKALARQGHFDEARELFLSRHPKFGAHSLPNRSTAEGANREVACYSG